MNRSTCRFLFASLLLAIAVAPTLAADERLAGSSRSERNGWVFVHLEGPPERLGFQHGYLLADEIADLLRVSRAYFKRTTNRDWQFYRRASEKMLWKGIDDEYRREIDGIVDGLVAKGVEADRWDLVALNALEELPYYYVPWLDRKKGKAPATHAPGNCSAFVATGSYTKDGRIVMGHNAWTNYVVGTRWNIIFDLKPEKGHRILMDGLPGVIVSDDDFGVNDAGILVTETTITQFEGWDPDGKPEFARARKAMQYSESIDDYVKIMLDGNNGGYANDWLLGDNKTGEIAQFELGLKNHSVRRKKDGYFVGANFPVDPKLIAEETKFDPEKKDSSPNARRTRWERLMAEYKGRIDVEAGKRFEADTFDPITEKEGANDRTLCGRCEVSPRGIPEWDWAPYFPGGTVQAKVIDARMAEDMSFWAAIGQPCGTDFLAAPFLKNHPEYEWMRNLLRDMKSRPWTLFETRRDRDTKVLGDRKEFLGSSAWIYNDLGGGVRAAKESGKPLLVVFRCIPCEACQEFDEQVAQRDPKVSDLLDQYVCVRIPQANAIDLTHFQFDFDQSFFAFLMEPDLTILARFGTRSERPEEQDISLDGLRKALEAGLQMHRNLDVVRPSLAGKQVKAEEVRYKSPGEYPSLAGKYGSKIRYEEKVAQSCMHCHQIRDAERRTYRDSGEPIPDEVLFPYPDPAVVGLSMDPEGMAAVKSVAPGSPAEADGLKAGDAITKLAGQPLLSIADLQWALHNAPASGELPAEVRRDGQSRNLTLHLKEGWRRGNISWRATTWELRRMGLGGMFLEDLSDQARKEAGLDKQSMALRARHVGEFGEHAVAKRAGFKTGDVIVAFDGMSDRESESQLLAHTLQRKRPGDEVAATVLRDGRRIELNFTLP